MIVLVRAKILAFPVLYAVSAPLSVFRPANVDFLGLHPPFLALWFAAMLLGV
jgi:hypothetical protein